MHNAETCRKYTGGKNMRCFCCHINTPNESQHRKACKQFCSICKRTKTDYCPSQGQIVSLEWKLHHLYLKIKAKDTLSNLFNHKETKEITVRLRDCLNQIHMEFSILQLWLSWTTELRPFGVSNDIFNRWDLEDKLITFALDCTPKSFK